MVASSPLIGVARFPPDADPRTHHGHLLRVRPRAPGDPLDAAGIGMRDDCDLLLESHGLDTALTTVEDAEDHVISLFLANSPVIVCRSLDALPAYLLAAGKMVRERCLRGSANTILFSNTRHAHMALGGLPDRGYQNGRWLTVGAVQGMAAFLGGAVPLGAAVVLYRGQGTVDAAACLYPGRGTAVAAPKPGYTDVSHYAVVIDIEG